MRHAGHCTPQQRLDHVKAPNFPDVFHVTASSVQKASLTFIHFGRSRLQQSFDSQCAMLTVHLKVQVCLCGHLNCGVVLRVKDQPDSVFPCSLLHRSCPGCNCRLTDLLLCGRYVEVQSGASYHMKATMVRQSARSSYTCNEATVGASISRHDLSIQQVNPKDSVCCRGFWAVLPRNKCTKLLCTLVC